MYFCLLTKLFQRQISNSILQPYPPHILSLIQYMRTVISMWKFCDPLTCSEINRNNWGEKLVWNSVNAVNSVNSINSVSILEVPEGKKQLHGANSENYYNLMNIIFTILSRNFSFKTLGKFREHLWNDALANFTLKWQFHQTCEWTNNLQAGGTRYN